MKRRPRSRARRIVRHVVLRRAPDLPGGSWLTMAGLDATDRMDEEIVDVNGRATGRRWKTFRPTRHVGVLLLPDGMVLRCPRGSGPDHHRVTVTGRSGPFLFSPPAVSDVNVSFNSVVAARRPRRVVRSGRVAVLGSSIALNYWHWLTDVVGDLWFLEQHGIDRTGIDRWVLPAADRPWQHEVLARLRIPRDQVVTRRELTRIDADELVLPIRQKSADVLPTWLAAAVRDALSWDVQTGEPTRRILVSRSDAPARRIANETDLLRRLEPHGFERVVLDGTGFAAQQELFASARTIVGSSGAGLTNLLWCRPGTRVIEILTHGLQVPAFPLLARQLRLDLVPIFSGMDDEQTVDHQLSQAMLDMITSLAVR